jgi:hypothetical protein
MIILQNQLIINFTYVFSNSEMKRFSVETFSFTYIIKRISKFFKFETVTYFIWKQKTLFEFKEQFPNVYDHDFDLSSAFHYSSFFAQRMFFVFAIVLFEFVGSDFDIKMTMVLDQLYLY